MIEVIADEVLIDAEIVAANESRRLGRQILQQSRDLIVGTPFQDVKVIEVLDIDRRVCQDDGCRFSVLPAAGASAARAVMAVTVKQRLVKSICHFFIEIPSHTQGKADHFFKIEIFSSRSIAFSRVSSRTANCSRAR